jgi:hypothetical protein
MNGCCTEHRHFAQQIRGFAMLLAYDHVVGYSANYSGTSQSHIAHINSILFQGAPPEGSQLTLKITFSLDVLIECHNRTRYGFYV